MAKATRFKLRERAEEVARLLRTTEGHARKYVKQGERLLKAVQKTTGEMGELLRKARRQGGKARVNRKRDPFEFMFPPRRRPKSAVARLLDTTKGHARQCVEQGERLLEKLPRIRAKVTDMISELSELSRQPRRQRSKAGIKKKDARRGLPQQQSKTGSDKIDI